MKETYMTILILAISMPLCSVQAATKEERRQGTGEATIQASLVGAGAQKQIVVANSVLTEAEAYKLLYESEKKSNEEIVQTIQWSIGLVGTFLLAIAGSQIFFNYRLGKEELASIRSELKSENELRISALSEAVRSELERRTSEQDAQARAAREESSRALGERLTLYTKQVEVIDERLKQETLRIRAELEEAVGHIWDLRGVKANAITRFINVAFMELESGATALVKYQLGNIIKTLPKVDDLWVGDFNRLESLMEKLPAEYDSERVQIRALYTNKPVYEFLEQVTPETGQKYRYIRNAPAKSA